MASGRAGAGHDEALAIERLHHVSLPVSDLARARRFYTEVLGLAEIERPPFDFPGAWFRLGDGQLHLIAGHPAPTLRAAPGPDSRDVHFAVRVADFDRARRRLRRLGFREEAPADDPRRMKVSIGGRAGFPQIFIADPDGHVIEINAAG